MSLGVSDWGVYSIVPSCINSSLGTPTRGFLILGRISVKLDSALAGPTYSPVSLDVSAWTDCLRLARGR